MLDDACNHNAASCHSDVDSKLDAAVGCLVGILNRISWMQAKYPLRKGDKIAFKTSTCFVDHLWELFAPFLLGEPAHHIPSSVCCYSCMYMLALISTYVCLCLKPLWQLRLDMSRCRCPALHCARPRVLQSIAQRRTLRKQSQALHALVMVKWWTQFRHCRC